MPTLTSARAWFRDWFPDWKLVIAAGLAVIGGYLRFVGDAGIVAAGREVVFVFAILLFYAAIATAVYRGAKRVVAGVRAAG